MCARNEQEHIAKALSSIRTQTLPPSEIIVVNDGSTDETSNIARSLGAKVIDLPYHAESVAGTPLLAERYNVGLASVSNSEYVLIIGADDVFPSDYIQTLVSRMEDNPKLVIASGQIGDTPTKSTAPRGGGRMVKTWFWRGVNGMRFPPLWCWEEYIVYKALSLGYEVRGYDDVKFQRIREEGRSVKKGVGDGRSMYCLGFWWGNVASRCITYLPKKPRLAASTFYGWLTAHNNLEKADVAEWVHNTQRKKFYSKLKLQRTMLR